MPAGRGCEGKGPLVQSQQVARLHVGNPGPGSTRVPGSTNWRRAPLRAAALPVLAAWFIRACSCAGDIRPALAACPLSPYLACWTIFVPPDRDDALVCTRLDRNAPVRGTIIQALRATRALMSYDSAVDQDRSTTPLDRSSDARSGQYRWLMDPFPRPCAPTWKPGWATWPGRRCRRVDLCRCPGRQHGSRAGEWRLLGCPQRAGWLRGRSLRCTRPLLVKEASDGRAHRGSRRWWAGRDQRPAWFSGLEHRAQSARHQALFVGHERSPRCRGCGDDSVPCPGHSWG